MKFLLRLKMASECGMMIPTTLCSNDPKEIQLFRLKHETNIRHLDFPDTQSLQKMPRIFQEEVNQRYALRVICFGDYLMATKLPEVKAYSLPDDLVSKIHLFMHELGIACATFDFAVTLENQYVFLDVNEHPEFLSPHPIYQSTTAQQQ